MGKNKKKKLKALKRRVAPVAVEPVAPEPEEPKFKRAVQELVDRGEYPGPTAVNRLLGRDPASHAMRRFSGRESRWRGEVLKANGWVYVGDPDQVQGSSRTWVPREQARRARRSRSKRAAARAA